MRGVVMHAPGDVRIEDRATRGSSSRRTRSSACRRRACAGRTYGRTEGSTMSWPAPMGHEYVGSSRRSAATSRRSSPASSSSARSGPLTTPARSAAPAIRAPASSACAIGRAQAELLRVPLADGTLVATPGIRPTTSSRACWRPPTSLAPAGSPPSRRRPGGQNGGGRGRRRRRAVAVLAAKQLGAERIIAMSRHQPRQRLAREYGATDIVEERGDDGVAAIKELTNGLGAHSVVEAVGTQESMMQAIRSTRPGGHVGFVGVSHGVALPGRSCSAATSTSRAVPPRCAGSCPN